MKRRRFLRGLGGITLSLPFLGVLGRASQTSAQLVTGPTRMITVAYPMGTHVPNWMPSAVGSSFTLPRITESLAPFQDRCLFVSNCDHQIHPLVGAHRNGHPGKEQTALTGSLTGECMGGDGSNTMANVISGGGAGGGAYSASVDEIVGRHLRSPIHAQPSVGLAVNGRPDRTRDLVTSRFFHESAGNPASLQADVGAAFNALFAGVGGEPTVDPAIEALHQRNQSVLDAVRANFTDLRQGLDRRDRIVLDDHAAKIRQLELDVMRATCNVPSGDFTGGNGQPMNVVGPLQNRIAAAAMGCQLAPTARIEYIEQQNPTFGLPVVDDHVASTGEDWHALVHAIDDTSVGRIDGFKFFVDMFAHLMGELDAIPEGPDGGSVLDSTLVLLATNFGPGNGHSARKMCFVLGGNTGVGKSGYHFDGAPGMNFYTASNYNVNHVLNSIVQMVGVTNPDGSPMTSIGLQGFADDGIADLFA